MHNSKHNSLFIFLNGKDPSAQAFRCCGCVLDLGGVKVRIGDILVADFSDVSLRDVVLQEKKYRHLIREKGTIPRMDTLLRYEQNS